MKNWVIDYVNGVIANASAVRVKTNNILETTHKFQRRLKKLRRYINKEIHRASSQGAYRVKIFPSLGNGDSDIISNFIVDELKNLGYHVDVSIFAVIIDWSDETNA